MMNDVSLLMFIATMNGEVEVVKALVEFVKGIEIPYGLLGVILTIITPFAAFNGAIGLIERITGKKFARADKKEDKGQEIESINTVTALHKIDEFQPYKIAEVLTAIRYENIEAIQKMEVILITSEGVRLPMEVEGFSSNVMKKHFAFIEKAQSIEYMRLEQVLYDDCELVDTIQIGTKMM